MYTLHVNEIYSVGHQNALRIARDRATVIEILFAGSLVNPGEKYQHVAAAMNAMAADFDPTKGDELLLAGSSPAQPENGIVV